MAALSAGACEGGDPAGDAVERVDSAGVTLVTSGAEDRPLSAELVADFRLGGKDDETESFYEVNGLSVAVSADGRIAVLDADNHRVLVYDGDGTHLRTLGRHGEGPGELSWPIGIFWDTEGRLMVHDISRPTPVGWDDAGDPVEGVRLPEDFFGGRVAGWGDGLLLAGQTVDPPGRRLVRVDSAGDPTVLTSIPQPEGSVVEMKSCGMTISGMPPIFTPGLRWSVGGGVLAVAEGVGYVVDLYREDTRERSVRRPLEPRAATPALARAEIGDDMRVMTDQGERVCDAGEVAEQRGFAERIPVVGNVAVTPDGRLWVARRGVGDEPVLIDLFDAEGVYEGTLPAGTAFPVGFLPDGRVMWTETDDLDVERLVVGRLVEGEGE